MASPGNRILAWLDDDRPGRSQRVASARRMLRTAVIALREFRRNDLSLRASALTLTILLSLVPILAMSAAVIKGLGGDNHLHQLAREGLAILEQQAVPLAPDSGSAAAGTTLLDHLRTAVETIFDYVDRTNFAALGGIGTLAFVVSILLVLHQVEEAMNTIWQVAAGRSFLRKLSDYITLLVLMPLAVNVGFAASALIERPELLTRLDAFIPVFWLEGQLLKTIPVIVISLALWVLYLFFPNTRVRPLPALAGALFAAVCWFAAQSLFVSMQIGVSRYNAIYGSFAGLPLFLLWLHFVWLVVLAGAQLACAIQKGASMRLSGNPDQASRRLDAGFAIIIEVQRAFAEQRQLSLADLERLLPGHDRETVRAVGANLARAGLLHVSAADGRLLPAGPAEVFRPSALVEAIVGTTPSSEHPPQHNKKAGKSPSPP